MVRDSVDSELCAPSDLMFCEMLSHPLMLNALFSATFPSE